MPIQVQAKVLTRPWRGLNKVEWFSQESRGRGDHTEGAVPADQHRGSEGCPDLFRLSWRKGEGTDQQQASPSQSNPREGAHPVC